MRQSGCPCCRSSAGGTFLQEYQELMQQRRPLHFPLNRRKCCSSIQDLSRLARCATSRHKPKSLHAAKKTPKLYMTATTLTPHSDTMSARGSIMAPNCAPP